MGGVGEFGLWEGFVQLGVLLFIFCWEQICVYDQFGDKWLVIECCVYDISCWVQWYLGGSCFIGYYGVEDVMDVFCVFY